MISLNKGTVEFIAVNVEDVLGNLTDLAGSSCKFTTRIRNVEPPDIQDDQITANVSGMSALCLIDTTQSDKYDAGLDYELFVSFVDLPSTPLLGPVHFKVIE